MTALKRKRGEALLSLPDDLLARCLMRVVSSSAGFSAMQKLGRLQLVCRRFRVIVLHKMQDAWSFVRLTDHVDRDTLTLFVRHLCTRVSQSNRVTGIEAWLDGWNDERASVSRLCDVMMAFGESLEVMDVVVGCLEPTQEYRLEPERLTQALENACRLESLYLRVQEEMTFPLPPIPSLRLVQLEMPPEAPLQAATTILWEQTTLTKLCVLSTGWCPGEQSFERFLARMPNLEMLVLRVGKVYADQLLFCSKGPLRSVRSVHVETAIPQHGYGFLRSFPCVEDLTLMVDARSRRSTATPPTLPFLPRLRRALFSGTYLGDGLQALAQLTTLQDLRIIGCGMRTCDGLREVSRLTSVDIRERQVILSLRGLPPSVEHLSCDGPLLDAHALSLCPSVTKLALANTSPSIRNVPWLTLAPSLEILVVSPAALRCLAHVITPVDFSRLRMIQIDGPATTEEEEVVVGTLLDELDPQTIQAVRWIGRRHEGSLKFAYQYQNATRLLLFRNPDDARMFMKDL